MIIILEEQTGVVELAEQVAVVYEVADFNIPSGINESIFTDAGQIITSLSVNTPTVLNNPGVDGLVLTSKPTAVEKMEWRAAAASGGASSWTNKSGSSLAVGTVVILSNDYDNAFTTTTSDTDKRVMGVLAEAIANNADGAMLGIGRGIILVQGNVARGQWLVTSNTVGRARAAGYTKPSYGGLGIAMEAYSGGGAGSVAAWVMADTYLGATSARGYILGGYTTAVVNNGQILSYASITTALTTSANLSLARYWAAGVSGASAGYAMGGHATAVVVTTDKVTYSTDTTAAQASANLSLARYYAAGLGGSFLGYAAGGNTGAGSSSIVDGVNFASDVSSAVVSATLPLAVGRAANVFAG